MVGCALLLGMLLLAGCESPADRMESRSVKHRIAAGQAEALANGHNLTSLGQLDAIKTVAVAAEGGKPYRVVARTDKLALFPCSECHTKPLQNLRALSAAKGRASHWSVSVKHASPGVMDCETCHAEPARMDQLWMLSGTPVSIDQAYLVCGQCHFKQARDWRGGAHGKRLGGWAPPRVIRNCTGCHNPHRPAIPSRWPALLPNAPAKHR